MLHRNSGKVLPSSTSDINLAEQFADFFINKVPSTHEGLTENSANLHCNPSSAKLPDVSSTLPEFKPLSSGNIEEIIKSSPSKSCSLDPIPTVFLKDHPCVLLPLTTRIVHLSLRSLFPSSLKKSIITPLLKKPSLDPEVINHCRPVSNLSVISKVIENAVAHQLNDHLLANDLYKIYQSAYKRFHTTETALLMVQNGILMALDDRRAVFLLLLDLSTAFDTVQHSTLLCRLQSCYGFRGMESYLCNCKQSDAINFSVSSSHDLHFGVPVLFSLYTSTITDIIRSHGLKYLFHQIFTVPCS